MILLTDAAKYYKGLDHQDCAWDYLQDQVGIEVMQEFAEMYRTDPRLNDESESTEELVSLYQLAGIWNCSETLIKQSEIDELNSCLNEWGITTPNRIKHFLSQTAHESGGGKWTKELSDGWYLEGRDDIGNTQPGDGPKFKGAGYIQISGRANFTDFSNWKLDDPLILQVGCDHVAANYPFTSAGFWWVSNRMNELCDADASVEQVTLRVNGGYNGLDDRKYYYGRCEQYIDG